MSNEIEIKQDSGIISVQSDLLEKVLLDGELAQLQPQQRLDYYKAVCDSLKLNPLTKPFEYITLNGKLRLYANKTATDQLRLKHNISIVRIERVETPDSYDVFATAKNADGRMDTSLGSVPLVNNYSKRLQGEALSNAKMKAETKAKRRVTLSICGLGWVDESEVGSIKGAKFVDVDFETGEIQQEQEPQQTTPESVPETITQPTMRALHAVGKNILQLHAPTLGLKGGITHDFVKHCANVSIKRKVGGLAEMLEKDAKTLKKGLQECYEAQEESVKYNWIIKQVESFIETIPENDEEES